MWSAWSLSPLHAHARRSVAPRPRRVPTPDPSGESSGTQRFSSGITGSPRIRRRLMLAVAAGTTFASVAIFGIASAPIAAAAATAPAAAQCNPLDNVPTSAPAGAGDEVSCNISVTNSTGYLGSPRSTITATACLAAAGVLPPADCITTVTMANTFVTSINQCNGIVYGGGSNVTCNVTFINDVANGSPMSGATVNQCIGSGTGGGTQPTTVCAPVASTTNATVTQCNGSGTGGGGSMRVKCTVTGGSTARPVSINQCNGSSNGGGSTVTCTTTFINNVAAVSPTTTPTTGSGVTPAAGSASASGGTSSGGTTGAGGASGASSGGAGAASLTGGSGSASGSGSSAGSAGSAGSGSPTGSLGVIPTGAPQTGMGGASHSNEGALVVLGLSALAAAALVATLTTRRRRILSDGGRNGAS